MTDLFGEWNSFETIDHIFAAFALRPDVDFQVLTKRPERLAKYLNKPYMPGAICDAAIKMDHTIVTRDLKEYDCGVYSKLTGPTWPLRNVWLGVSCENQQQADARIPYLLECPAAVRFLSVEPLLGPVDLVHNKGLDGWDYLCGWNPAIEPDGADTSRISWVIVGGESGPRARPCRTSWIHSLRDQCKTAATPIFIKQLGATPIDDAPRCQIDCGCGFHHGFADRKRGDMSEWPKDLRVREFPNVGPDDV